MKITKHGVFGFILGAIIFGSISAYAVTIISSSSVSYLNTSSGITSTNVQGAIDELYAKSSTGNQQDWELKLNVRSNLSSWRSGDGWGNSLANGIVTVTSTNGIISTSIDGPSTACSFVGTKNFYLATDNVELISFELK